MSKKHPPESPENRTFRSEGWLMLAIPAALLLIAIVAAMVVPWFVHE